QSRRAFLRCLITGSNGAGVKEISIGHLSGQITLSDLLKARHHYVSKLRIVVIPGSKSGDKFHPLGFVKRIPWHWHHPLIRRGEYTEFGPSCVARQDGKGDWFSCGGFGRSSGRLYNCWADNGNDGRAPWKGGVTFDRPSNIRSIKIGSG